MDTFHYCTLQKPSKEPNPKDINNRRQKRSLVHYAKLWPSRHTLKIAFMDNPTSEHKKNIIAAAENISMQTMAMMIHWLRWLVLLLMILHPKMKCSTGCFLMPMQTLLMHQSFVAIPSQPCGRRSKHMPFQCAYI